MPPRPLRPVAPAALTLLTLLALVLATAATPSAAAGAGPALRVAAGTPKPDPKPEPKPDPKPGLEGYARYQPQTVCSPRAKPGMVVLGRWMVRSFGGRFGGISRACSRGTSEHKEGRAFDWTVNVRSKADRLRVRRFLDAVFAADAAGNRHVRARRMGIMYIIWADRIWSAWDGFKPRPYLSSSCRSVRRCSATLRHRDHVHVSITRPAARGRTSWFAGRL